MPQLILPFSPPVLPHRDKPALRTSYSIPRAAAWEIFNQCWAQYSAFLEAELHSPEIFAFMEDVQSQFRALYPDAQLGLRIHNKLVDRPSGFPATRQALGEAFLSAGLWPVKSYFGR